MPSKKAPTINTNTPYGWFLAGTHPSEYEATLDTKIFHSGSRSCRVECNVKKASGWTTLMQNMAPKPYLNKRLRMVFWIRTEGVGYASGWMRVDGPRKSEMLAFDNMCNRTMKGTNDWIQQEIVLDIPEESTNIGFGIIHNGSGKMWADDFSFEIVPKLVPITSCNCSPGCNQKLPKNLDFESDNESES